MRMSAVQTDEQLVYVVRCLVAYADACGLFNSKPELQEKADKFSDDYLAMLAMKKAARERKTVAPPEAERIDEKAAVMKAEEKKEEPSQRSIQELEKRDTPILRLEIPKIEQKELQPLQIFENDKQLQKVGQVLSPYAIPVPQPEELIQPALSPAPLQQFKKPMQPVLSPFVAPAQQLPKQPSPFVIPVQQSQPQTEAPISIFVAPIQESQNQIQTLPSPIIGPVQQKPQNQIQALPSPIIGPVQQKPQNQIQALPSPIIGPVQQPQKQFQPATTDFLVPIQQQKQLQPVLIASAAISNPLAQLVIEESIPPSQLKPNQELKPVKMPSSPTKANKT
ncbi:unnamed protein product [Acanthocheilonema viteae]|uniref:Uncharacterized protein n=1 Tax=Acanthocheilonema viteae TaxID=6277 RepID=A0A498SRA0_ACAVI|nr:unnamed protein product [Acanthocheilonema viteae]